MSRARTGRLPGRRHGAGQDRAGHRPPPPPVAAQAGEAGTPTLVVCPTSLLGNWERELTRFAPALPVRRFHGGDRHLDDLVDDEVVLATYGVLRRERSVVGGRRLRAGGGRRSPARQEPVVGDGPALGPSRRGPLALTGTPVENRLTELWAILDLTTPGLLGPLEASGAPWPSPSSATMTRRPPSACPTSSARSSSAGGRRTRPSLPTCPSGRSPTWPCRSPPNRCRCTRPRYARPCDAIATKSGIERQGLVLRLLTVLKQICNHPAQYLHQAGPLPGRSGKLAALEELLDVIVDAGDSVLVFSQFVEMCSLVETHLASLHVPTLFLHGGARPQTRRDGRPVPGRHRAGVPTVPEGRRSRPQPDASHTRDPLRPLVESGRGGPGKRPGSPDRPATRRADPPAGVRGHPRRPHRRASREQTRPRRIGRRSRRGLDRRPERLGAGRPSAPRAGRR